MKKLLFLSLCTFTSLAFAAETPSSVKIGVLDAEKILRTAPQVAAINKKLESQFRPVHDKIVKEQQDLQTEIDKLNRDAPTMSDKERNALQDRIIADKTKLRSDQDNFQQNLNNAQDQAMGKFLETLKTAINKVATAQGYDLILLKQAAAYNTPKYDVTDQVSANLK